MAINLPVLNPNIITIGSLSIRFYSIAYIIGIISTWYLTCRVNNSLKSKIFYDNSNLKDDFFLYVVFSIIIGGRLGYVILYNISYYLRHIKEIFYIWEGGMSFHGGFIGIAIGLYMFCKKYKINYINFTDIIVNYIPIGLFLGRIANFINQELCGKITNVKWGIIFAGSNIIRHPSQIYEALLEGLVLFIILNSVTRYTKLRYKGLTTSLFMILYALFRFFVEFFREPDSQIGYILDYLTLGQILSIPLLLLGLYFLTQISKQDE